MRYRYMTCDVFTSERFGGNPLAVLPDAQGLTTCQMQAIARELNLSETVFVLPPDEAAHAARVRIFTPRAEIPFAGHPTVGAALALSWLNRVPAEGSIVLEEGAGPVPVDLAAGVAEFRAPGPIERGSPADPAAVAEALGLPREALLTSHGMPCDASAGLPFLMVEVADGTALAAAKLKGDGIGLSPGSESGLYLFTRAESRSGNELYARMFGPAHGIIEDPATGSAAAALVGLLAAIDPAPGWRSWQIAQGVEMGRPSLIKARAQCADGRVTEVRIAGTAVPVCEGTIEV
jgi:trans-2,3-dihydro-3-hydroxyanthranilate isomerase